MNDSEGGRGGYRRGGDFRGGFRGRGEMRGGFRGGERGGFRGGERGGIRGGERGGFRGGDREIGRMPPSYEDMVAHRELRPAFKDSYIPQTDPLQFTGDNFPDVFASPELYFRSPHNFMRGRGMPDRPYRGRGIPDMGRRGMDRP